jgi:uncharacterized protein YjaZ
MNGVKMVPVIATDKWLAENFAEPIEICKRIVKDDKEKAKAFYQYLLSFGMYQPTSKNQQAFELLQKKTVWKKVKTLYAKYQKEWDGPDIPLYIFPMHERPQLFKRSTTTKSGLSFQDKLFLFLTPGLSEKELEALFVHEYHHVCRMTKITKNIHDYTLLDSIVLEGLAEFAVEEVCGVDYLADWCTFYTKDQIETLTKKLLANQLTVKKDSKLHNQLLFGGGSYPSMLGYASGYAIVTNYRNQNKFSLKDSFSISSDVFVPFI